MKNHTTVYRISKNGQQITFDSEKDACAFLVVAQCSVASCYRRKAKCKGWDIEKVRSSSHGETKTRLFKIWGSMHERCERSKHKHYADYGGRGITVCKEWKEFVPFRDWANLNGYSENRSIDRINVNAGYSPENCRWVTTKEQANNKRNNHRVSWNGNTFTLAEWADISGLNPTTIKERLKAGWSVEDALSKPVRKRTKGYRSSSAKMDGGENDGN